MHLTLSVLFAVLFYTIDGLSGSGFSFSAGQHRALIHYKTYHNLIILPVKLNNNLDVNLILDTGSHSIVLFGEKFKGLSDATSIRNISFRGRGADGAVKASLLLMEAVDFGAIHGEGLGVVVVSSRRLMPESSKIDGLIGYDLFSYFVVEINYRDKTIQLFDKLMPGYTDNFESIPMDLDSGRPHIVSQLGLRNNETKATRLLVDTGSSLSLAFFSNNKKGYDALKSDSVQCIALSGYIFGVPVKVKQLSVGRLKIHHPVAHFVWIRKSQDALPESASLGGGFLRKYVVIFDNSSATFYVRKNTARGHSSY